VFLKEPSFVTLSISIELSIGPYAWSVSRIYFAYFGFCLLVLIVWMCSLNLVSQVLPVWPHIYWGSLLILIDMSLLLLNLSYSSVTEFRLFFIVLVVLSAVSMFEFLNSSVIVLVSFPGYINVSSLFLFLIVSLLLLCFCILYIICDG
jgi:hypothetical protein